MICFLTWLELIFTQRPFGPCLLAVVVRNLKAEVRVCQERCWICPRIWGGGGGGLKFSRARDWKIVGEGFCVDKADAGVCEIEVELFNSALHYLLVGLQMQKAAFSEYGDGTWKLSLMEKPRRGRWCFNSSIARYLCWNDLAGFLAILANRPFDYTGLADRTAASGW